jgi:hypothetical protein
LQKTPRLRHCPQSGVRPKIDREVCMKIAWRVSALSLLLAGAAPAATGERFAEIPLDKMTPQRTVADAIMSGPRKGLSGPFNAWRQPGTGGPAAEGRRISPLQHLAGQAAQRDGDHHDRAALELDL